MYGLIKASSKLKNRSEKSRAHFDAASHPTRGSPAPVASDPKASRSGTLVATTPVAAAAAAGPSSATAPAVQQPKTFLQELNSIDLDKLTNDDFK